MKYRAVFIGLLGAVFCGIVRADPPLPVKSGEYTFQHRDAEFPNSQGFPVKVSIRGYKIVVTNPKPHGPIPSGILYDATIMWHAKTRQWILGDSDSDREAPEVGGCSGGPEVIDFKARIIWSCIGGP
jgi:hypothetical protein